MKKVIVRLANGLGNQLFTYAAAYSFAKKNNAKLYIDDESGFYKRNKYELHNFNITAPIIEKEYKFLNTFSRIKRKILIKLSKFNSNKKFLIEKKNNKKLCEYNPEQLNVSFNRNLYFEGYFQSEKYYQLDIKNILKEFTFNNNIINQKNSIVEDIKKSNSVSIHLRENKFLKDEGHKNLDELNYAFKKNNISIIKKGIEYFDKNIEDPKYFIWSKDMSEIESIFKSKKYVLVDQNFDKDAAYDLYLMSLCKHFILSPSSMHYWGAFLSTYSKKICISPPQHLNTSGYYGFSNNKDIKADWWRDI